LIIYAVKICKQCLQTSSAYKLPAGALPLDTTGDFHSQAPWAIAPQMKITGAVTSREVPLE